jgi:dTDP-4-amino-4,6-dideoxygalactose transaminase
MPVPLLDVNAQNLPLEAELTAAFQRVLKHGMFILGKEVDTFEAEMREFLGVKHAIGVSSGTDALVLALMALDIQPGDEVLCPAFTFFATAGSVARLGAVPVLVDVCPVCFNLDVNDARRKLTPKTKAIMPVHLFGQSADMDPILALAQEHGLKVIEDTAQALGPIGILVTSAGIAGSNGKVVDYAPAEWRQIVEINLTGTFNCCRAVLPQMQAQSYGRIVTVASIAGK